jgi:hypothetical protein
MKIKQKLASRFDAFITAAYPAWLARLARKLVRPSNQARPLTLPRFMIFPTKGRSV